MHIDNLVYARVDLLSPVKNILYFELIYEYDCRICMKAQCDFKNETSALRKYLGFILSQDRIGSSNECFTFMQKIYNVITVSIVTHIKYFVYYT